MIERPESKADFHILCLCGLAGLCLVWGCDAAVDMAFTVRDGYWPEREDYFQLLFNVAMLYIVIRWYGDRVAMYEYERSYDADR